MLEQFLKELGTVIGRTYTKEEFGKIIDEAAKAYIEAKQKRADGNEKKDNAEKKISKHFLFIK